MITVAQKIRQLLSLEASLPEKFVELAEDYGTTSVALVKEESIEKGINKDGQSGSKVNYSSKPVRSSSLMDAALNASGRSYLKNQPTATYYGLRQAQGMTSPVVNLSYTGEMWKGFRLVSVTATSSGASIRIGATGQHAQVFVANIKRYGAFYKATPEQQQRLRENMHLTTRRWFTNE